MPERQGNNPQHGIVSGGTGDPDDPNRLPDETRCTGSARRKRAPADPDFRPLANPRPTGSPCDRDQTIERDEAKALFHEGPRRGMIGDGGAGALPKRVRVADREGRAHEAKLERGGRSRHGHETGDGDDAMRQPVVRERKTRGLPC